MEPGSSDGEIQTFENEKKYLKAAKKGEAATAVANSESKDLVNVKKWKVFSEFEADDLQTRANELAADLKAKDPQGRYLIVTDYDPEKKTSFWHGLFNKRKVGTISVYRTTDTGDSGVSFFHKSSANVHDPQFITSLENIYGVVKNLSFQNKLDMISNLEYSKYHPDNKYFRALYDAIMSDLFEEMEDLREADNLLSRNEVRKKLKKLQQFSEFQFRKDSSSVSFLSDMVADLKHVWNLKAGLWGKILPFHQQGRISSVANGIIDDMFSKKWWGNKKDLVKSFKEKVTQNINDREKFYKEYREQIAQNIDTENNEMGYWERRSLKKQKLAENKTAVVEAYKDLQGHTSHLSSDRKAYPSNLIVDTEDLNAVRAGRKEVRDNIRDVAQSTNDLRRMNSGEVDFDPQIATRLQSKNCISDTIQRAMASLKKLKP